MKASSLVERDRAASRKHGDLFGHGQQRQQLLLHLRPGGCSPSLGNHQNNQNFGNDESGADPGDQDNESLGNSDDDESLGNNEDDENEDSSDGSE
jgi:hypothetical protein